MNTLVDYWGRCVFYFLCVSIALVGVGNFELPVVKIGVSAWSSSRNVLLFWIIWKCLVWARNGRRSIWVHETFVPLPLFLFLVIVTLSLLPEFQQLKDYRYFLLSLAHYLMVLDLFSSVKRLKILLCFLGIIPAILLIRGIVADPAVLDLSEMTRLGGPYYPTRAGYVLSMAAPLALAVTLDRNIWLRSLGILSFSMQVAALLLTYSRGAWLGWASAMILLGFAAKRFRRCFLAIMLVFVLLLLVTPVMRGRLVTFVYPFADQSTSLRIEIMKDALSLAFERPLLGVGYGLGRLKESLEAKYPGEQPVEYRHSHNFYISLLVGTGLLGLSAFLWLLAMSLSGLLSAVRTQADDASRVVYLCIAAAFIAFMVTGLGEVPLYHNETRIFFFTLLALAQLYVGQRNSVTDPRS